MTDDQVEVVVQAATTCAVIVEGEQDVEDPAAEADAVVVEELDTVVEIVVEEAAPCTVTESP